MYKFSVPMPYRREDIDKLLNINKIVQKSAITSLYFCVPRFCEVFTGFELARNLSDNKNWDYWKGLISYTLEQGVDFIYLLNSPRPMDIENPDFSAKLEKLELLLSELHKIGVTKLRIASAQLMSYISKNYPDFQIFASTSFEYKTMREYQNFISFHPEVRQIVPSHDLNKNFKLLSNLKKQYSNLQIEIMVNEGCMQGCPNRLLHSMLSIDKHIAINNDVCLSDYYCNSLCNPYKHENPIESLLLGNLVFPWDISEYKKIGITNFKFVGRDRYLNDCQHNIDALIIYLKGIDSIKNIEGCSLISFVHHLNFSNFNQLTIKKYKKYLPSIKHFKKYGNLCSSKCGIECKYCFKCAKKIEMAFNKELNKIDEDFAYTSACKM